MIANGKRRIIVVPWCFNGTSRIALDRALDMADDQTFIRVVHVAAPLSGPDNGMLYATAEKQHCRNLEARFREQVERDERTKRVRFHVVYGHAGHEIARFAELHDAELIVTASRQRKGLSKLLIGGMAERVVRLAPCAVFVCKDAVLQQPITLNRAGTGDRQTPSGMSSPEHYQS